MTSPYLDTQVMSLAERRAKLASDARDCEAFAIEAPTMKLRRRFADMAVRLRAQLDNLTEE